MADISESIYIGIQIHKESCNIIPLNLQRFAKEGQGGEKTEPATEKKLSDARKEGQVAKSQDLVQSGSLLTFFIVLKIWALTMGNYFMKIFEVSYARMPQMTTLVSGTISSKDFCSMLNYFILRMLIIVIPIFAAGIAVSIGLNALQFKWEVTAKPLKPKFNKLNPINGFKRMFSKDKLVDLLKSLAKLGLLMYLAYSTLKNEFSSLFILWNIDLKSAIGLIGNLAINLGLKISAFLLVIGFIDFGYQKWKFAEDMKMTKQEVKDEWKNTEGDPAIKGQQRQRMREASRRRMMQSVPEADVVITNPTHFAVAIKYNPEIADAPFVTAKGADFMAQRIKDTAREAGVEIVENKPLARMLYYNVELGESIPPELFQTVAEILAVIYNARAAS